MDPMDPMDPLFDIVIVSFNTRDLLRDCLSALMDQEAVTYRAIVVDNASADDSAQMVTAEFPAARLIALPTNLGFAGGTNRGLAEATAPFILLLNSDTRIRPGALARIAEVFERDPQAGLVAARLLNEDGTFQPSCVPARFPWSYQSPKRAGRLLWASGAALAVRRSCLDAVGPLDEQFFYTGEDCDWGLRVRRQGWSVLFCPEAEVVHRGAASRKHVPRRCAEGLHFGRQHFYFKHYGLAGLAYARLHSTVELTGQALRQEGEDRSFALGLLRRTWTRWPARARP